GSLGFVLSESSVGATDMLPNALLIEIPQRIVQFDAERGQIADGSVRLCHLRMLCTGNDGSDRRIVQAPAQGHLRHCQSLRDQRLEGVRQLHADLERIVFPSRGTLFLLCFRAFSDITWPKQQSQKRSFSGQFSENTNEVE